MHVPHKGSAEARNDVIGGHVQMMLTPSRPWRQRMRARCGAGTSGRTLDRAARVPTVSEAGVPGYEAMIWLGIMAPKGTPPGIVDRLNAEIARINEALDREAWAKQGAVPMTMTPAEFDTYLRADTEKWAKVIQQAGIKVQ